MAVGSWQLAVGSWQLVVGSWQLVIDRKKKEEGIKNFLIVFTHA
ncbi:hypothetical protein [Microcoleus sp. POL10_C6]